MAGGARCGFLFDTDGVIVDTFDLHRASIVALCERHGSELTPDDFRHRVFGRPNTEWIPDILGRDLTIETIRGLADEKERDYRERYRLASPAPLAGLEELLSDARRRGVRCALASSAPRANVDLVMKSTGLTAYFDAVLSEGSVQEGKPDPAIFLAAASELDVAPAACVVFEDSVVGLRAADRAGCRSVAVATTFTAAELKGHADAVVADFRSLSVGWLQQLITSPTL